MELAVVVDVAEPVQFDVLEFEHLACDVQGLGRQHVEPKALDEGVNVEEVAGAL